jgi:hypothetical protein
VTGRLSGARLAGEGEGQLGLAVSEVGKALFPVTAGFADGDVFAGLAFVSGAAEIYGFFLCHGAFIRQKARFFNAPAGIPNRPAPALTFPL